MQGSVCKRQHQAGHQTRHGPGSWEDTQLSEIEGEAAPAAGQPGIVSLSSQAGKVDREASCAVLDWDDVQEGVPSSHSFHACVQGDAAVALLAAGQQSLQRREGQPREVMVVALGRKVALLVIISFYKERSGYEDWIMPRGMRPVAVMGALDG
ncbi:hypothetical protein HaLaN_10888 [Haematococcus lacustris]|uniref:Uncharacterized protein n=1 Tax=Haematococcus lacustris TaxID=44745 RepID=A0A699Z7E5_HAELA|nr:hypothetical protein HaLaN_10888 [Haematococcus lacustris]